jgi:hypothetical protein
MIKKATFMTQDASIDVDFALFRKPPSQASSTLPQASFSPPLPSAKSPT